MSHNSSSHSPPSSHSPSPSSSSSSNSHSHSHSHSSHTHTHGHSHSHRHSSHSSSSNSSSSSHRTSHDISNLAKPESDLNLLKGEKKSNLKIDFDKYEDIPVETSGYDCPPPISTWKEADLGSTILSNIHAAKYDKPTPVQRHSIPIVLRGRDLMGCAQTGSGKTAAFLLPSIAQFLRGRSGQYGYGRKAHPTVLILAPTRELASQIHEEAVKFGYKTGIRSSVVYGGAPIHSQLRELERGCDLLVATPGRLSDILDRQKVGLSQIKFLILDEADRMLDMGFEPQIRKIVEQSDMPKTGQRQTLMFSATFAKEIQHLAASFLHNYIFLAVGRVGSTTELVTQKFIQVQDEKAKERALIDLITKIKGLTLIFVETKKKASQLDWFLRKQGFAATSIHGDRQQQDREAALKSFESGQTPFLIATNVAARGLDIENVSHVVNYEMPTNVDDYVHRIGRTGRAGKAGLSTAFIGPDNLTLAPKLVEILRESHQEIPSWLEALRNLGKVKGPHPPNQRQYQNQHQRQSHAGAYKFGGTDFRSQFHHQQQQSGFSHPYSQSQSQPSPNTSTNAHTNNNANTNDAVPTYHNISGAPRSLPASNSYSSTSASSTAASNFSVYPNNTLASHPTLHSQIPSYASSAYSQYLPSSYPYTYPSAYSNFLFYNPNAYSALHNPSQLSSVTAYNNSTASTTSSSTSSNNNIANNSGTGVSASMTSATPTASDIQQNKKRSTEDATVHDDRKRIKH